MPNINRIRVNNVKYNFGTQSYDDFIMKMYGKNTLYDLANGGGKSVLMLLLMQCVIPNSTLDDKQPIEKLFRGNDNSCIHSLIEWKLDESDISEGLRYMTTGFAAKKAGGGASSDQLMIEGTESVQETGENEKTTAEIEYFNYCIFYRDYNKNDIVNLPLVKGEERITYKGLKNYLLDLARNDKNIIVRVFDRKGEYQRFIAGYGLYESQWELIRGINRTEGHVRTYFETNFRTTRKIIEDLLIEEIIEKAYAVKTETEAGSAGNTAGLLMTIQEELKTLAEKKKRAAEYDYEKELVELLSDRVDAFASLFREKEKVARGFASIYRTIEIEKEAADEELAKLEKEHADLVARSERISHEIQQLKIGITKSVKDKAFEKLEALKKQSEEVLSEIQEKKIELEYRIAAGEYIDLLAARKKLESLDEERRRADSGEKDKIDIGCIAYNIKIRMDERLAELAAKEREVTARIKELQETIISNNKMREEAVRNLAMTEGRIEDADSKYNASIEASKALQEGLSERRLLPPNELLRAAEGRLAGVEKNIENDKIFLEEQAAEIGSTGTEKNELEQRIAVLKENEARYKEEERQQREDSKRLVSFAGIYGMADYDESSSSVRELADKIQSAIRNDYIRVHETGKAVTESENRLKDIEMGVILRRNPDAEKVKDYIITRHSLSVISGMDYLSVQPAEKRKKLLMNNPSLPYGLLVEGLAEMTDDPGLTELDLTSEILLFDKDKVESIYRSDGEDTFAIRHSEEFYIDEDITAQLRSVESERLRNLTEERRAVQDMLVTKQEDLAFTEVYIGRGYDILNENIKKNKKELMEATDSMNLLQEKERKLEAEKEKVTERLAVSEADVAVIKADIEILKEMTKLSEEQRKLTTETAALKASADKIRGMLTDYEICIKKAEGESGDNRTILQGILDERKEMEFNWDKKYSIYYSDLERPDLNMTLPELTSLYERQAITEESDIFSMEKEKLLRDTLSDSIRRLERSIADKNVDIASLEEKEVKGELFRTPEDELLKKNSEIMEMSERYKEKNGALENAKTEYQRLAGQLEYAEKALHDSFGEDLELPEGIDYEQELERKNEELKAQKTGIEEAEKKLKKFRSRVNDSEELMRYAGRITEKDEVDTSGAEVLSRDTDLKALFDDLLLDYDRINKNIDRTKNDTLKVKMMVVDTLSSMGATELSVSIRDDVGLPGNRVEADELLKSLNSEAELIVLEKDRIEKSLTSMEKLRENFIDQCIERCIDVKTELGKIQHLSEISLDDEKIEMIKLSIPYVKNEFMKDRMSDYIDRIVAELDKKATESERQKFLNQSLSMKKLFSVIVTDMNKIKLSLYKRERIKEQSRYLKYEEAVGSTGQSQGIYIQFLISVINYISGMYAAGDGQKRTKTLFIDNPFGAAKDIYIWEPIFRLLQENYVQLVVPTRGATPEITGRFDVNYILGQQKSGKRQTTVVVNYSSNVESQEMEYIQLDYEQQTLDFI